VLPCVRADVDDPVSAPDDVEFVFDDEKRISGGFQTVQCAE
jgi:hypothetical protein